METFLAKRLDVDDATSYLIMLFSLKLQVLLLAFDGKREVGRKVIALYRTKSELVLITSGFRVIT